MGLASCLSLARCTFVCGHHVVRSQPRGIGAVATKLALFQPRMLKLPDRRCGGSQSGATPTGPVRSASRSETSSPAIRPVCSALGIWKADSGPLLELEVFGRFAEPAETGKTRDQSMVEIPLPAGLRPVSGRWDPAE